tara:strand:- start:13402 stop:13581 length:180 start_codon:yes stop_codon:yes gene_type:complete
MVRPCRVSDRHKIDCGNCYGNGCADCCHRGWFETAEGREEREEAEDYRADSIRKGEYNE